MRSNRYSGFIKELEKAGCINRYSPSVSQEKVSGQSGRPPDKEPPDSKEIFNLVVFLLFCVAICMTLDSILCLIIGAFGLIVLFVALYNDAL